MNKRNSILKYFLTVIGHSIFWLVIYYFYAYFLGYGSSNTRYVNLFSGFLMPVTILISYFLIYYLIPNFLLTKKYKYFILYSVYTFVISVYVIILSILYGLIYSEGYKEVDTAPLTKTIPFIVLGVYFVVLIVVSLSLVMHNYNSIVNNENLKNKILQTQLQIKDQELRFLKTQIHPHFLFNSLNTIYGFALKKKDEAPEMILKLSNLLDYILYQINKSKVSLQEEILHVKEYLELEKIRFQDMLKITFSSDQISEEIKVAPMLLIPFVENAFKHGASIDGFLQVNIAITFLENSLDFQIKNTVKANKVREIKEGIGLRNIRERLQIIFANPGLLKIEDNKKEFKVTLTIPQK